MELNKRKANAASAGEFPVLAALRLDDRDLQALSRQGFVAHEQRNGRSHHKLRFRRDGRQRVRYVPHAAVALEKELHALQQQRLLERELAALHRRGRVLFDEMKVRLAPIVAAEGLIFHGFSIRRPRRLYRRPDTNFVED